jgi:ketosteroid isomerase-like protein
MSQENVEIVNRYFGAAMRRLATYWDAPRSIVAAMEANELDPESLGMLAQMHEGIRWTNAMRDVYQGKAACARGIDELLQASQAYSMTVEEVTDLGGDHVLAVLGVAMKGKTSGVEAGESLFSLVTLREGLIVEMDEYLNRSEALKAVGLAE